MNKWLRFFRFTYRYARTHVHSSHYVNLRMVCVWKRVCMCVYFCSIFSFYTWSLLRRELFYIKICWIQSNLTKTKPIKKTCHRLSVKVRENKLSHRWNWFGACRPQSGEIRFMPDFVWASLIMICVGFVRRARFCYTAFDLVVIWKWNIILSEIQIWNKENNNNNIESLLTYCILSSRKNAATKEPYCKSLIVILEWSVLYL